MKTIIVHIFYLMSFIQELNFKLKSLLPLISRIYDSCLMEGLEKEIRTIRWNSGMLEKKKFQSKKIQSKMQPKPL